MMLQGEEGVREVLQILNDEFRLSMALSGKRNPVFGVGGFGEKWISDVTSLPPQ